MAEHLVVLMVGVIVDAETEKDAARKAQVPFQHGLLPNMTQVEIGGVRKARAADRAKLMQERVCRTISYMGEES